MKQFWDDNKFNIGMVVGGLAAMAGFAVGTSIASKRDRQPYPWANLPDTRPNRTLVIVPKGEFEAPFNFKEMFEKKAV
jgi:hypothetical protein